MNTINDYINALIEKAGLNEVEPDELESYKKQLETELSKRIALVSLNNLSQEAAEQFAAEIASKDDVNASLEFFNRNIPDYPEVLQKLLVEFEQEFLANFVEQA